MVKDLLIDKTMTGLTALQARTRVSWHSTWRCPARGSSLTLRRADYARRVHPWRLVGRDFVFFAYHVMPACSSWCWTSWLFSSGTFLAGHWALTGRRAFASR